MECVLDYCCRLLLLVVWLCCFVFLLVDLFRCDCLVRLVLVGFGLLMLRLYGMLEYLLFCCLIYIFN